MEVDYCAALTSIKSVLKTQFIGKLNNNFFIHEFSNKVKNNELLTSTILNFMTKHKVKIDNNFSIIVNCGPGSFSSLRISLSVAKGIQIVHGSKLYGFKSDQLSEFKLENIEILIKNNLLKNKMINPIYHKRD